MPSLKSKRQNKWLSMFFGSVDVIATIFSLFAASLFTNRYTSEIVSFNDEFIIVSLIVLITWIILLKATHLARIPRTSAVPVLISDFIRLTLIGGSILSFLDWLISLDSFPSLTIIIFILFNFFILFTIRLLTFKVFKRFRANGHNVRNVVLIANESSETIIDKLLSQKEWGFRLLHIITDSKYIMNKYMGQVKIYPKAINIKSILRYDIVDELICCDCAFSENRFTELIQFAKELGIIVRVQGNQPFPSKYKMRRQYFDRIPFFTIENNPTTRFSHIVKNVLEISVAFSLLLLFSPILAVLSLIIFLTSRGPVVYKQERVGLRGRKFHIYMFRSTYFSSGNKINGSNSAHLSSKPNFTPIGEFIGKYRLDFIPQFLNVIKGEMALIGPKAPTTEEVSNFEEWQLKLLSVKPGITCTWQIATDRAIKRDKQAVMMDIQYIDNWNLKSDIGLFFKTFKTVLFSR